MKSSEMKLESSVFKSGSTIPEEYTAHGRDISPPFHWSGIPAEAQSLVLICEDANATSQGQPFTHWILFNIEAGRTKIPAGIANRESKLVEYRQGENSFHEAGYSGPNPPRGTGTHHYHFKLYALDATLDLPEGCSREEILTAMKGHVLGETEYIGLHDFH